MNKSAFDLRLRFSDIVFIVVFIISLAWGQKMLSVDSDLGRHLTLGNYMLNERIIPTRDMLSYTKNGLSRPPYEWLSQILFALAYRLFGLDGVIIFTSLILAILFTMIYNFANRRSGSPLIAIILTFITAGSSSLHWLPRPHIITFLLVAVWIENLEKLTIGKPIKMYTFPTIMVLWANLHGGFVFGILAWFAYAAGWLWETWHNKPNKILGVNLLIIGISSLMATIITPDLWHNWDAVLNNRNAYILNRTVETMRPTLTDPAVLPFTFLLFMTILVFAINWRSVKSNHFFLLTGIGIMSLSMARNIPLFAIACTPILSEMIAKRLLKFKTWTQIEERFAGFGLTIRQSGWSYGAALLAVSLIVYFHLNKHHDVYQFNPVIFPVEATKFLDENPQNGNMFNEFNWGGYLLYKLWPGNNVFLDSQSDFYGEELMREYNQVMSASVEWQDILQEHQVDWVIVPAKSTLANAIATNAKWGIIYADDTSVIGIRK